MPTVALSVIGFILVAIGIIFFVVVIRSLSPDEVSRRLHNYVSEPVFVSHELDQLPSIRSKELTGSLLTRTILPGFKRLGRLFGRLTPASTIEDLAHQLVIAGNPMGLGAREFYGIRLLFIVLGFWLAFILLRNGIDQFTLLYAAMAIFLSSFLPKQWLKSRVRSRQNKIRKGLPDALDMLSVCADAGLGFDQSLLRVSQEWNTPLAVEFGRVVSEMEMGISRQRALRNLSQRLDIPELSSFVAVILQSDQLGMSISDTLHAQAEQMREERRFRAQEEARKLPLKMLFPMLFLIFPAMMGVILGPVVPVLAEVFSTMVEATTR